MIKNTFSGLFFAIICCVSWAQNPTDVRFATEQANLRLQEMVREVAAISGLSPSLVASYTKGGKNYPERLSLEGDFSGRQFRAITRVVGEKNEQAKQEFAHRGLPIPDWLPKDLNP